MIQHFEIRNAARQIQAIIENAESIIWQTDFDGPGAFEITIPYAEHLLTLLQPNSFITRTDRDQLGVIESIGMTYAKGSARKIKVAGRFGLVFLERRLCGYPSAYALRSQHYTSSASVEGVCRQLVNKSMISADWSSRNIPFVQLGTPLTNTATIEEQTFGEQTVLEATQGVLRNNTGNTRYGQRMRFNASDLNLYYEIYEGRDLRKKLVFSPENENLLSFEYLKDTALYKNRFVTAGDGEGAAQFTVNVNRGNSSGANLAEFFYKASTPRTYKDENDTEHTLSAAQYAAALAAETRGIFNEHYTAVTAAGTIDLTGLEYGKDFREGDVVLLKDSGIRTAHRILTVTERQDGAGYSIAAEFGG